MTLTKNRYQDFIVAVPKNERRTYVIQEEGYAYSVKLPDYISFTGNLAITNSEKGELLIIWPLINGGYEYGMRFQKDGEAYEIYVDDNMQPVNKDDVQTVQLVQKYKSEIDELFERARESGVLNNDGFGSIN
ncbi:hypothetical protein AB4Z29_18420 [Paenibacillus sp. 2TAB23]|uniref:hypothetical protein n=1 Tax=Paenibacillus sp. 2TAB23 TaxID=3233004 RepID=UPI003F99992A